MYLYLIVVYFLLPIQQVQANGLDWVNPSYVLRSIDSPQTSDARNTIVRLAASTARKGPFTVVNPDDVQPPSGDPRDYLSWAPYWWPDCNWCPSKPRNRIAHSDGDESSLRPDDEKYEAEDPYTPYYAVQFTERAPALPVAQNILEGETLLVHTNVPYLTKMASPSEHTRVADGAPPPQAGAKATKESCTPSPTTPMAPSATWTTCPYKVHDGQRNPDVRQLKDVQVVYTAFNSIMYNALAYAFTKSSTYSANAARFIDVFFLSPHTGMNPSIQFGQLIRGPGAEGQRGTYQGVLDMRWLAHVGNAVTLLKKSGAPEWNSRKDNAFNKWMTEYAQWLEGSYAGRQASTKANNHGTFYAAQLASIKMLLGDGGGAAKIIRRYFEGTFQDQVARNGNQPLEWSRTRPFHYICFNLEAMITLAKLADQLSLGFWTYQSRYGATIQDAVNFAMSVAPQAKREDVTEVLPHVLTIATIYGDPEGKYAAFIQQWSPSDQPYYLQPWWFYDQPQAFSSSRKAARSIRWARDDVDLFKCPGEALFIGGVQKVELDYGLYVDCSELEPFYNV